MLLFEFFLFSVDYPETEWTPIYEELSSEYSPNANDLQSSKWEEGLHSNTKRILSFNTRNYNPMGRGGNKREREISEGGLNKRMINFRTRSWERPTKREVTMGEPESKRLMNFNTNKRLMNFNTNKRLMNFDTNKRLMSFNTAKRPMSFVTGKRLMNFNTNKRPMNFATDKRPMNFITN